MINYNNNILKFLRHSYLLMLLLYAIIKMNNVRLKVLILYFDYITNF